MIIETYSKRARRKAKGNSPDVYRYDDIPLPLRNQIIHIWSEAIGPYVHRGNLNSAWHFIHKTMCRELGVFRLVGFESDLFKQCSEYLQQAEVEHALDIIELSFFTIDRSIRNIHPYNREDMGITTNPDDAIDELNMRFQEHAIGYQYVDGVILRIDSQFLHREVVKPALALLVSRNFSGPEEEFRAAHSYLRKGDYKEANANALKALESTLKAICDERKWAYPPSATANKLLDIVFERKLVSSAHKAHFATIRASLESGVPPIRNAMGGHGQGKELVAIPGYVASYAIHCAAAAIVLLVESHINNNN